jgi:hypothetical protein
MKPRKQDKVAKAPPDNITPMAQFGLPRTPRTVALANLLARITAQYITNLPKAS